MRSSIFAIGLLCLFVSCQSQSEKKAPQKDKQEKKEEVEQRTFLTSSGMEFKVNIYPSLGVSVNRVVVETNHFSEHNAIYKLGNIDPIHNIWLTDLDHNGFEELIITTTSAGSGSYGRIYAFASNRDKSTSHVHVKPITSLENYPSIKSAYRGHDRIFLDSGKQLRRSFPVYLDDDPNASPRVDTLVVSYTLTPGEAGWILTPNLLIPTE